MTQYEVEELLRNSDKALNNKQIAERLNISKKRVITSIYRLVSFYKEKIKVSSRKVKDNRVNYYKWVD